MSQWLPIHPTIIDPSSGEPLRALTVIGNMPVWPSIGGQDDDNQGGSEDGDDSQGGDGDDKDNGQQEEGKDDDKDSSKTYTPEEYEALHRRMQAADRRASDLQSKVKEFEDKDKTELQKAEGERDSERDRANAAEEALRGERIANAFLASNTVTWHDPSDALAMLRSRYMDGVEIDDKGQVTGIKKAIEKMAKEKKYLVNSGSGASSTGDQMNGARKGEKPDTQKAKDEDIRRRMPALGRQ